jgi:hypothetical protein
MLGPMGHVWSHDIKKRTSMVAFLGAFSVLFVYCWLEVLGLNSTNIIPGLLRWKFGLGRKIGIY